MMGTGKMKVFLYRDSLSAGDYEGTACNIYQLWKKCGIKFKIMFISLHNHISFHDFAKLKCFITCKEWADVWWWTSNK